ncbi:TetR/AcrR family transcriptional regulator [Notoacmeibacter ruber]|nr:TetR/AcrR family transcriptional regulator [Notoacmeibacter ruber]
MASEASQTGAAQESSRLEILQAAAECFEQRGFSGTSVDDVARMLGCTKGRIYHHFGSKADLFAAVFRLGMEMNFAAVEPLRHTDGPAVARLRMMAEEHVRQMVTTKSFQRVVWDGMELLMRGALTPEQRDECLRLQQSRKRYSTLFRTLMEEAKADGDLDYGDLSVATQVFFTCMNSPVFWYRPRVADLRNDQDTVIEQVVRFAMNGLGWKGE